MEFDGSEESASQVTFHTIFGTYKEDLGILKRITDKEIWSLSPTGDSGRHYLTYLQFDVSYKFIN